MKKIFSLFVAALFCASMFAAQDGTLTSSVTPIDPSATVTLTYNGAGTNFANWQPDCFIHAWLSAKSGQTLSKDYGTKWVDCNGSLEGVDENRKMTYAGVPEAHDGLYTISLNIKEFFGVEDEDLDKIGKLNVMVCTQYVAKPGDEDNNKTNTLSLDVQVYQTLYFVNVQGWTEVKAHVWTGESTAYKAWDDDDAMKLEETKVNGFDLYSYSFPANYENVIFRGKDAQTADLTWDAAKPYFSMKRIGNSGEWYATAAEIPVPATFYITGNKALVGEEHEWESGEKALNATADSYVFENLPAGHYIFKVITLEGAWLGYDELTEASKADELYPDVNRNVNFILTAAGDVTITYKKDEVFKVEGALVIPEVKLNGLHETQDALEISADKKTASATLNLTAQSYLFKLIIADSWLGRLQPAETNYEIKEGWYNVDSLSWDGQEIKLTPIMPGDYKFTYTFATGKLEVTYPEVEITLEDGYYIIGLNDWWNIYNLAAADKFAVNPKDGDEYVLANVTLTEGKRFKVVQVAEKVITNWYGANDNNDYEVTSEVAGVKDIYFRPKGKTEWGTSHIWVTDAGATAIDNTAAEVKAVKVVENGQLFIIKNGVKYDVTGAIVK